MLPPFEMPVAKLLDTSPEAVERLEWQLVAALKEESLRRVRQLLNRRLALVPLMPPLPFEGGGAVPFARIACGGERASPTATGRCAEPPFRLPRGPTGPWRPGRRE
jgi:hypothetical protein